MSNKNENIRKYVLSKSDIEAPEIQDKFSVSYSATRKIIYELINKGVLKFDSGVVYKVVRKAIPVPEYTARNEEENIFIKALWQCVKLNSASLLLVQRCCSCSYNLAARALDWMEKKGYIGEYPERRMKISVDEYCRIFGTPDDVDDNNQADGEQDDRTRREFLEKRRQELIARMQQPFGNYEDDSAAKDKNNEDREVDTEVDLRTFLIKCLERGLQYKSKDGKYVVGLDGQTQFELKFIRDSDMLMISDGGKTLQQTVQSKRKIKNVLKRFEPVVLENEEISISVKNPFGTLMGLLILYSAVDAVKKIK